MVHGVGGSGYRGRGACGRFVGAKGVALGYPYSSQIKGSAIAMRELRVQSGGRPLRVLYAFDPKRAAVLLLGGDKSGDDRFYEKYVPIAEQIYKRHLGLK
ncbi:type II toxin-antitoxin system RelE/ParE family toxin [Candidatus Binatus sp.]|uniref:type II toxin-antitoxin system RelE/ParE family toxin n=1 Tax=Candidatus Binatus sp. TaxID=2811406 RepID=UPI00351D0521